MTKAQTAEQNRVEIALMRERLRDWIKPGDTAYTILDHVSRSGMSRSIRVVLPYTNDDGTIAYRHPNYAVGKVLSLRHWKQYGYEQPSLVLSGGGMDMGFHLIYTLSVALYGDGYAVRHSWI